jgi:hypothetical protein
MNHRFLTLLLLAALGAARALAHGGVELGPNGGRILEFSENETMHGELTLTNGTFRVALLDKDMKPVALRDQTLTVSGGSRLNPQKPVVEKQGAHFVFPALKGDRYALVLRFTDTPPSRTVTARLEYDAAVCSGCGHAEWLCKCPPAKGK